MKSALILIGGASSRANGSPKYKFMMDGKTFLERQIEELHLCSDEIFIVARDKDQAAQVQPFPNVTIITDIMKGLGPAGGVHAGAWQVRGDYFFVTACDMPFLSCKVISFLFSQALGCGGAVPVWDNGRFEPLCAVYSRSKVQDYYKTHENRRLSDLVENIQAHLVPVSKIRSIDPELNIFVNINDLKSLTELIQKKKS